MKHIFGLLTILLGTSYGKSFPLVLKMIHSCEPQTAEIILDNLDINVGDGNLLNY